MIRAATTEDLAVMVQLGREFYEASPLAKYAPYDELSARATFLAMLEGDAAAIFLVERDGQVVGGIGGVVALNPYNYDILHGEEAFWFMSPTARTSPREAVGLILYLRQWAASKGAVSFVMAGLYGEHFEKVTALYDRMDMTRMEEHWIGGV